MTQTVPALTRTKEESCLLDANASPSLPSYSFLGIRVNPLTIAELNVRIGDAIKQNARWIIANHNLHSVYLFRRDMKFRSFFDLASLIHVDGMPLVYLGRLFGFPLKSRHRVTYVDWLDPLLADAARMGWRVFYLGSKPGIAECGAALLRQKHAGLRIEVAHGYFDTYGESAENLAMLDRINSYQPNILLVGMGMPRQEHWVLDNIQRLRANAILTAGATMDYVVGVISTPPRWAGRRGMEWCFRLADEPGRLWRRYLIEPLTLVGPISTELLKNLSHRVYRKFVSRTRSTRGELQ
jgi:N-acetylglucosaminyldiphosphoundecaprenol N-acetyl-beta-D-mannosaminyltransferase